MVTLPTIQITYTKSVTLSSELYSKHYDFLFTKLVKLAPLSVIPAPAKADINSGGDPSRTKNSIRPCGSKKAVISCPDNA